MAHPIKPEAVEAIRQHLAEHGPNNWNLVLDKYKGVVHEQTIWAWIRLVKASPEVPVKQLNTAAAAIAKVTDGVIDHRAVEQLREGTEVIARDIPASPSPAYVAKTGANGLANIDFMVELKRLYRDGELLRAYSMKAIKDPETGEDAEAIKNPGTFERSITRRAAILDTALKAMGEIWDLRMQQQFYEAIIDEIGRAAPEVQKRILERLAVLNQKHGMTTAMRA